MMPKSSPRYSIIIALAIVAFFSGYLALRSQNGNTGNHQIVPAYDLPNKQIWVADKTTPFEAEPDAYDSIFKETNTLSGTTIYDTVMTSPDNKLVLSKSIIDLFDYFLTTSGELSDSQINQGITIYLNNRFQEPALTQAKEILHSYLSMIEEMETMNETQAPPLSLSEITHSHLLNNRESVMDDLKNNLHLIKSIRRKHMGQTMAEAFWGNDEAYDEYTLKHLEIISNNDLTLPEKEAALTTLKTQLNSETNSQHWNYSQSVIDPELANYLDSTTDTNTIQRIKKLNKSRTLFKIKYNQYLVEKNDILDSTLSKHDQNTAIAALQSSLFNEQEQNQVNILDKQKFLVEK